MNALVQANLHYLAQAEHLLAQLDDGLFQQGSPSFYRSSIGGHLRHCLDHYDSFLNGAAAGKVDYDERMRLPALETETESAAAKTKEIRDRLQALAHTSPTTEVSVKMDCGQETVTWQPSTFGREMQFLISHTVHHFAMIGGICQEFGISPAPDFGTAPSTLRHRAQISA